jgi:hypothetical protein
MRPWFERRVPVGDRKMLDPKFTVAMEGAYLQVKSG